MKNDVREMIKNVIEENAIKFKSSTSTTLYQKIGNRLKDEYKNVAKKMFKSLNESAPAIALGDSEASVSAIGNPAYSPPGFPGTQQYGPLNPNQTPTWPGESWPPLDDPWWDDFWNYEWNSPNIRPGEIPQLISPPDPNKYWPGGFQGAPGGDPNRPESWTPPPRNSFPKGPNGDQQHQQAHERYRERYERFMRDRQEYKRYMEERRRIVSPPKKGKEKNTPLGPAGGGPSSSATP